MKQKIKIASEILDEIDTSFRYSVIPKTEKRMIEKIAWGNGIEEKDDSNNTR